MRTDHMPLITELFWPLNHMYLTGLFVCFVGSGNLPYNFWEPLKLLSVIVSSLGQRACCAQGLVIWHCFALRYQDTKSIPRSSTLGGTMWYGKLNWVLKHTKHGPLNLVLFPSTIFAVLMLVILGNNTALKTTQKELEKIEVKGTFICLTLV